MCRGHFCSFLIVGLCDGAQGEKKGSALKTGVAISGTIFIANPIWVEVGECGGALAENARMPVPHLLSPVYAIPCMGPCHVLE